MISRRDFLKLSVATGAAAYVASRAKFLLNARAAQSPQIPLAGAAIPKFVDPVPNLLDADHLILDSGASINLEMREQLVNVLPTGAVPGYMGTYVWSYLKPGQAGRTSYLGPVVVATRGQPTEMKFTNLLGDAAATNVLAYKYGTDQTLHWADPLNGEANMWNHMAMPPAVGSVGAANYDGPIPACVHLHGGEVPPQLDGGPDTWMTSDGLYQGHAYYTHPLRAVLGNEAVYRYPNSQEGALIWFHDHTLGATRLNVYAGLAGAYLLVDPANDPANLPELFPLVIQDRMFDTNGQLFFPADSAGNFLWAPNPEHPYWVPEFVGDTIVVNGKSWPYLNVERKRYTFLFLNGSNARTYEMFLSDPVTNVASPTMWVIGTDGGYLDRPVPVKKLTMMSGERYMVIMDFAAVPTGTNFILRNTAKTPFPAGAASPASTTGQIMQFRVQGALGTDSSFNPAVLGASLRGGAGQGPAIVRLANPATGTVAASVTIQKTRQLSLNEVMGMPQNAIDPVTGVMTAYPGGPLEILVNNTKWGGERIVGVDNTDPMMPMYMMEPIPGFTPRDNGNGTFTYYSEVPNEGETEIWEIVNLTADAHPIHLHLVQFQLMNRQNFDTGKYNAAYAAAFPGGGYDHMTGQPYPAGVYIPAFGPPLNYAPSAASGNKFGGNPDVTLFLKGKVSMPLPQEAGWKDTVVMYPGQVTRIAVRWAPTDLPANTPAANAFFPFDPDGGHGYVWHCHIVDHEDNEMMRPDAVTPNQNATRTFIKGVDY